MTTYDEVLTYAKSIPLEVAYLAPKVFDGEVEERDIEYARYLISAGYRGYEWLNVLAGGNPEEIEHLTDLVRDELIREVQNA
jgi:hypothetical protein